MRDAHKNMQKQNLMVLSEAMREALQNVKALRTRRTRKRDRQTIHRLA
jgi:hypothetical protein